MIPPRTPGFGPLSPEEAEGLGEAVYGACFERYDRHRPPFAPTVTTARQAWRQLHEEQRSMCRDQGAAARRWLEAHGWRRVGDPT